MISSPPPVFVLGRFPPPIDGQTVATERLASLLEEGFLVDRVNLSAPEELVAAAVRLRPGRILHHLRITSHIRQTLRYCPETPVLWPAASPALLGHTRDLLTVLPALASTQPAYAVIHRGDFHQLFERTTARRSARLMVQRLQGVIFLSEALAERCSPWIPPAKRHVIPNTIPDHRISAANEVAHKQHERPQRNVLRVLFLSNMIPSKGYGDVLEAVRLLVERGVPVEARFAGRWPSDRAARAFAEAAQCIPGGAVSHLGPIHDHGAVRALHLWADVLALPTYYPTEAQPLVLIEAMSAGTPVVTTAHGGIPEMISDEEEGLFVPARAPERLADALSALRDPARWAHSSQAARARFLSAYSPEAVRAQWARLLTASSSNPASQPTLAGP